MLVNDSAEFLLLRRRRSEGAAAHLPTSAGGAEWMRQLLGLLEDGSGDGLLHDLLLDLLLLQMRLNGKSGGTLASGHVHGHLVAV